MGIKVIIICLFITFLNSAQTNKKIVYIVSDINIPFWEIMSRGINSKAKELGYELEIYSSNNLKKTELQNMAKAISSKVDGIIISPINSSTAVTLLGHAQNLNIPVVIADIGSDSKNYLSFISSDNKEGAYKLGKILANKMVELKLNKDGTVGIIGIPQKRTNGKLRTDGFMKALKESNIKAAGIYQQVNFSYEETYSYSIKLIKENPNLKAIWLQGSDKYQAALNAIKDTNKDNEILLTCFDAEPIFLELIPKGILLGAAMQQPYLMGKKALTSLDDYFNNRKVEKEQQLEILAISKDNIEQELDVIKLNVLGIE